jgi:hypothetical protein
MRPPKVATFSDMCHPPTQVVELKGAKDMKGSGLRYSSAEGRGYISGDDNNRYTFTPAELKDVRTIEEGMRVYFHPVDRVAKDIFLST